MVDVPILHAVTTDQILLRSDFLARAIGVMQALGERGAIHVRSRLIDAADLYDLTCRLISLHVETGCWCVVNDRLDLALGANAHGVQLTGHSMTVEDARRVAPKLKLGASVHDPAEAVSAEANGADWCVAGHVFETESHPGVPRRETTFISDVARSVNTPVIAIGGILPEHVPSLLHTGAYGIAVVRGIWEAKNSADAAVSYLSAYDGNGAPTVSNRSGSAL